MAALQRPLADASAQPRPSAATVMLTPPSPSPPSQRARLSGAEGEGGVSEAEEGGRGRGRRRRGLGFALDAEEAESAGRVLGQPGHQEVLNGASGEDEADHLLGKPRGLATLAPGRGCEEAASSPPRLGSV